MMENHFISLGSECLTLNRREYLEQLNYSSSRIRQDKKIEDDMKQEYSGRELYEMLQNADDEGSPRVEIVLTEDNCVHVKNWGNRPFTEGGLISIMRSSLSTKTGDAYKNTSIKPIGNKGLGFRSLLNWSDEITIHSNGVKCSFSKEIAGAAWQGIKDTALKNNPELDLSQFERDNNESPLAILSIPRAEKDDITLSDINPCTTDIEVHCKGSGIVADIEEKLKTLPCSVLLFLRNIKEIRIDCKGEIRTIKVASKSEEAIGKVTIMENGQENVFYLSYFKQDGDFEVGLAYSLNKSVDTSRLYSYFPTSVRLNTCGIYHGTFQLDSSRNHLVKSLDNDKVLRELGRLAIKMSCYLAENKLLVNPWDSFDLINFKKAEIEAAMLEPLSEEIVREFPTAAVLPTVNKQYGNLRSSSWIGRNMAAWLSDNPDCQGKLNSHIAYGTEDIFSRDKILGETVCTHHRREKMDVYHDSLEEIGTGEMTVDARANLIDALVKDIDGGELKNKISLLTDENGKIILADKESPAYVLSISGDYHSIPKCLKIQVVDSDLIKLLQTRWAVRSPRDVTDRLSKATVARDGDISEIRRKVESWSKRDGEMDESGMKEVLRWAYDYYKKTGDSPHRFFSDLCLFNEEGNKRPACSLILCNKQDRLFNEFLTGVDKKWLLLGDIQEWMQILGTDSENDVQDFLFEFVGVSKYIPVAQEYFGDKWDYLDKVRDDNSKRQIPNWTCNNFAEKNKNKDYNYSYVPVAEFFDEINLSRAIGFLIKEERANTSILNNEIRACYRTIKSEKVRYSYAAYRLRSYKIFEPLKNAVISSSTFNTSIDYGYIEREFGLDSIAIDVLLLSLGAHKSSKEFTIEQLYEFLSDPGDSKGVQKRYRELREAIRNKQIPESEMCRIRDKYLTHVWAKIDGKTEWTPVAETYYWDNEQLPHKILKHLPKLEIGSRVGEDSVKQIFGVKLAKDIEISFSDSVENEPLTKDLRKYLSERLKYFLAYRIGDDIQNETLIQSSLNALKQITYSLNVYKSSTYTINGEALSMEEGDILTVKNTADGFGLRYYICFSQQSCSNAVNDPVFSENLNEVLCMALKVTGDTMANYFRNIITHDINYIEYIREKDISPETWTLTLKSIGLREVDQKFWTGYNKVSEDKKIDISALSNRPLGQREILLATIPELKLPENYTSIEGLKPYELYQLIKSLGLKNPDCSELLGPDGLEAYYREYLDSKRPQYADRLCADLYRKTCDKIKSAEESDLVAIIDDYQNLSQKYNYLPVYEEELKRIKTEVLENEDLDKIIKDCMSKQFGDIPDCDTKIPTAIYPSYEKILAEYHLSEGALSREDAIIGKFEGLEKFFTERIKAYDCTGIKNNELPSENVNEILAIENGRCHSVINSAITESHRQKHLKSEGYVSDRAKYSAGKRAELATYEAMRKASDKYDEVKGCSTILNKESGDDNLHYDIRYHKTGDQPTNYRYLEVKSMVGNTIIMSNLEYEFAKKNADIYDFAIVHDDKISIVESPFSDRRGKAKFEVSPESYRICIEWDN
jgi:hypothetical protein